jgi:hypothetical protein
MSRDATGQDFSANHITTEAIKIVRLDEPHFLSNN